MTAGPTRSPRAFLFSISDSTRPAPPLTPDSRVLPPPSADLITGSFNYDNKYTLDAKNAPVDGLKLTCGATQKQNEPDPTGTLKSAYELAKGLVVEAEATLPGGKLSASVAHSDLVDGLKVTVSGDPKEPKGAKLALQMVKDAVGVKCDVKDLASGKPSLAANVCVASGDVAVGASADVDCQTAAVSKYAVAAQLALDDTTVALVLADELQTAKASVAAVLDADTKCAAEVSVKMKSKAVAASLALSKKFSDACSGKVSVSSPLPVNGGVFNPVLSLYTTGDVAAKTTASLSVQVETSKKYKYGVQFATKL